MSSFHTHSSWGRTRSPKNLTGTRTGAVTVLDHDATPVTTGISANTPANNGTTGYATENQRFLFVTVTATANGTPGRDVEVWWYMHAAGVWAFKETLDVDSLTAGTSKTFQIDINGVDRVAFVRDAGEWAHANREPTVVAACSTF